MKDYIFKKDGKTICVTRAESAGEAFNDIKDDYSQKDRERFDVLILEDERVAELEKKVEFLLSDAFKNGWNYEDLYNNQKTL